MSIKKRERKKVQARVAEWSKASVSGTGLFGGVGSNPTSCILTRKRRESIEAYIDIVIDSYR